MAEERSPVYPFLSFFFFLTVTFSNQIELRCRVDEEEGVDAEKIDKDLCREGSEKDGEDKGLWGERGKGGDEVAEGRGGKSTRELSGGIKGLVKVKDEGQWRGLGETSRGESTIGLLGTEFSTEAWTRVAVERTRGSNVAQEGEQCIGSIEPSKEEPMGGAKGMVSYESKLGGQAAARVLSNSSISWSIESETSPKRDRD